MHAFRSYSPAGRPPFGFAKGTIFVHTVVFKKSDVDAASGEGGVRQGGRAGGSTGGPLRCPRANRGFPIEFLWTLRGSSKIRSDPPACLTPYPGVPGFILLKTAV